MCILAMLKSNRKLNQICEKEEGEERQNTLTFTIVSHSLSFHNPLPKLTSLWNF